MSEVTSPILTDATGQDIVDKLDEIAQNLQPPTNIDASDVTYDNTQSGMTATDVQDAVTELKSNLIELVKHTTIEQNLSANTSNCIEIGDLKIQFGTQQCTANQYTSITFKKAFTSTGYVCFASYTSVNATQLNNPNASVTGQTTTGAKIYSSGGIYGWVAIGY